MRSIGLLSDTHGHLPAVLLHYFAGCQEIWHAGDIGHVSVADRLEAFKPLRAVYGNVDGMALRLRFPEHLRFTCEGVKVWLTHIAGQPSAYTPALRQTLAKQDGCPDLLIAGHTHIAKVTREEGFARPFYYINPGAAGRVGHHLVQTALRFTLDQGKIVTMEVVELGPRGHA